MAMWGFPTGIARLRAEEAGCGWWQMVILDMVRRRRCWNLHLWTQSSLRRLLLALALNSPHRRIVAVVYSPLPPFNYLAAYNLHSRPMSIRGTSLPPSGACKRGLGIYSRNLGKMVTNIRSKYDIVFTYKYITTYKIHLHSTLYSLTE